MVAENGTAFTSYAVVIGGGGALGKEIALELVSRGYKVILGVRKAVTGQNVVKSIKVITGSQDVEWAEIDFADLSSVSNFATELIARHLPVRLVINSAGVLAPVPGIKSHDTLDMAFSVNYLAPALLTHLLLPVLLKNGGSIVHVTCKEYAKSKELDLGFFTHQAEEADSQGMLRVTIERGKNICYGGTRSNKFTSPIVELDISGEKYVTTRKNNTRSPLWNETFTKQTTELPKSVHIEVFDGKPVPELSLGTAEIPLSGLTYKVGTLDSTLVTEVQVKDPRMTEGNNVTREMVQTLQTVMRNRKFEGQWESLRILHDIENYNEMETFQGYVARARGLAVVDAKRKVVAFSVKKRLNMLKTSTRVIKVDWGARQLKNETVHGRVRKTFNFLQITGTTLHPDNDKKLSVAFVKKSCTTVDGTLTVPGGQRDYVLTFESAEQRALFAEVLSLHTWSTPRVHGMKVEFNVMKKINKMTWALRTVVIDMGKKSIYNMAPTGIKGETANTEDGEIRRSFELTQVTGLDTSPTNPKIVKLGFRGGHGDYVIQFLGSDQKEAFFTIMAPYLSKSVDDGTVIVRVTYTRPAHTKHNKYIHRIDRTVLAPSTDDVHRPWTAEDQITIPIVPNWASRHWDTARNKRVDEITPLEAANTARMYMMTFCQELSKRLDQRGGSVKCHVFDPGMMSTRYTRKASGLGHWKSWHVWKAKRLGHSPILPAKGLVMAIHSQPLNTHNGVYIEFSKITGRIVLANLTPNRKEKLANPPHPHPATLNAAKSKALWEMTCQLLGADFENPTLKTYQALALS